MQGTPASLAAPAARKATAIMPCNAQAPIRREGRADRIEVALMLVSVGCEVESEENLRGWLPWQQPIYLDNIHRLFRYVADADFGKRDVSGGVLRGRVTARPYRAGRWLRAIPSTPGKRSVRVHVFRPREISAPQQAPRGEAWAAGRQAARRRRSQCR